jgi:hypothetical protein
MRRHLGSVLGTLLLLGSTSCIFLVDNVSVEESCTIEGSGTCATCMRTKCQSQIDGCCGNLTCSDLEGHSALLDGLDRCGGGDKVSCKRTLVTSSLSFDTKGDVLQRCIRVLCNDVCTGEANTTE